MSSEPVSQPAGSGLEGKSSLAVRLGLLYWLIPCGLALFIGGLFRPDEWYQTLAKPFFTPPNWLFAPVWTLLYIMIAISAWLVWRPQGFKGSARWPLVIFLVQLALNAAWSWLFFGQRRIDLALMDIIALFVLLVGLITLFNRENKTAAWLLIPYAGWISFATLLNLAFYRMNM